MCGGGEVDCAMGSFGLVCLGGDAGGCAVWVEGGVGGGGEGRGRDRGGIAMGDTCMFITIRVWDRVG